MRVNGLLIRWADGYATEFDSVSEGDLGRVNWQFLSIPDVRSYDEVERIVDAEFDRYAQEQLAFSITVDPRNGPVPFQDYGIGDSVLVPNIEAGTTTVRVSGITVTWDEEGNPYYAPELGEQVDPPEVLMSRAISRAFPGSLGGRSEIATPVSPRRDFGERSKAKDRVVATFYHANPATVGEESGYRRVTQRTHVTQATIEAKTAGGSATSFALYDEDDVFISTLTIQAGNKVQTVDVGSGGHVFALGERCYLETTAAGGHQQVTVELLRNP